MSRPLLAFLLALLGWLVPATAAVAATPPETIRTILRDCEDDGALSGSYRASELRDARRNIGTDLDQYSDCRDVLSAAELRAGAGGGADAGGGSGTTGGGTPSPDGAASGGSEVPGGTTAPAPAPTLGGTGPLLAPSGPEEQDALARLDDAPPAPVLVAGRPLALGEGAELASAAGGELPPSLVLVLVLLAVGALLAPLPYVRRRVAARRSAS